MSEDFVSLMIKNIMSSTHYETQYQRLYDLTTFRLIMEKFDVVSYLDNLILDRETYNEYFKDIVKRYDKKKHKRFIKELKNIMYPIFKTSKTTFLIPPLYDTNGNSFTPFESELLTA